MSEMIDLTNTDLGVENLGEMWSDFIDRCTPSQATLFNESYNLITISFPNSFLDSTITHLLIDEMIETSDLMSHMRELFIRSIVDALQMMGIIIDMDFVEMNSLKELNAVLDTIYMADGITDLIGLNDMLNYEDWDCKERFIGVMKMIQPQEDFSNMDYMIKDVSINTIRGLLIGINVLDEDDETFVDPVLRKRMRQNKPFLLKTIAAKHVADGGGTGQNIDTYLQLFMNELGLALVEDPIKYVRNVLGLMIISNLTDGEIVGQFNSMVEANMHTMEEIYKTSAILDEVTLNA